MSALDIMLVILALVALSFPVKAGVGVALDRVRSSAWEEGYGAGHGVGYAAGLRAANDADWGADIAA